MRWEARKEEDKIVVHKCQQRENEEQRLKRVLSLVMLWDNRREEGFKKVEFLVELVWKKSFSKEQPFQFRESFQQLCLVNISKETDKAQDVSCIEVDGDILATILVKNNPILRT